MVRFDTCPIALRLGVSGHRWDPHFAARQSVIEGEDPQQGAIPMPGIIPKLSDTPGRVDATGPKIGAHNQEIYSGLLGRSEAELKMLRDQGII